MIPKKIESHFIKTFQTKDNNNNIIEGEITCCNTRDFEVFVVGEIKYSIFSKMYLIPENNKIAIEARCRKCGKTISVFDGNCDGYDQCGNKTPTHIPTKRVECKKCRGSNFSIGVKYEYPSVQELAELGISEIDNAFTWVWSTLECNKCGAIYRNFVDYETA